MLKKGWMNVQHTKFPLNYLNSTFTPAKIFLGRKQLSWPKMLFVILFLNGILIIPMIIHFAENDAFELEATFPTAFVLVDQETVAALDLSSAENGQVVFPEPFLIQKSQGVIAGGWDKERTKAILNEERNVIAFTAEKLYLKEGELPISEVPYTKDIRLSGWTEAEEIKREIERQWYQYNRVFVIATYSFMITVILLVMNLLLIFGTAFFMFLAGRSAWIQISSYRESVNLIINALGLPILAAFLLGLIGIDVSMMMGIQTLGLAVMLVFIYFRTQFSEQYLLKEAGES